MRQRWSIFMLFAGQSLLWLLGICLVLFGAQVGTFINSAGAYIQLGYPFGYALELSNSHLFFSLALALTMFMLLRRCQAGKEQTGYTLRRLGLPLWQVGGLAGVNIAVCLIVLWGAEMAVLLALGRWYIPQLPAETWNHQTLALECYRNDLMSSVLPLSNGLRWARNGLMVLALAVSGANYGFCNWQKTKSRSALVMTVLSAFLFTGYPGSQGDVGVIVLCALVIGWSVLSSLSGVQEVQDEN